MQFKCYIKPHSYPVFVLQAEDKHWEQVCYQANFSCRNYCYITIKLLKYIPFDSIFWNSDKLVWPFFCWTAEFRLFYLSLRNINLFDSIFLAKSIFLYH